MDDLKTGSGSGGQLAALYTPENTTDCLKTENTAGGVLVSGVLKVSFVSPFTVSPP